MKVDALDIVLMLFWGGLCAVAAANGWGIGWVIAFAFFSGERWNHAWRD